MVICHFKANQEIHNLFSSKQTYTWHLGDLKEPGEKDGPLLPGKVDDLRLHSVLCFSWTHKLTLEWGTADTISAHLIFFWCFPRVQAVTNLRVSGADHLNPFGLRFGLQQGVADALLHSFLHIVGTAVTTVLDVQMLCCELHDIILLLRWNMCKAADRLSFS